MVGREGGEREREREREKGGEEEGRRKEGGRKAVRREGIGKCMKFCSIINSHFEDFLPMNSLSTVPAFHCTFFFFFGFCSFSTTGGFCIYI